MIEIRTPTRLVSATTVRTVAGRDVMSVASRIEGVRPGDFLRWAEGTPRGFWARGDRWVAHGGVTLRFEVDGPDARFTRVAEAARVSGSDGLSSGEEARLVGRLRFYGGFSFREDHRPSGFWESFPAALFLLPAVELVGDASGVLRLRLRDVVSDDPERCRAGLERRLGRVTQALHALAGRPREPAEQPAQVVEMGRVTWEDAVEEALAYIRGERFSKVVLARTRDLTTDAALDPADVVGHLWDQNPGTHVFLFEPRPGRPLLGAAPETVATLRHGVFHATAVAGSIARGETPAEQARLAEELLASAKDRDEHEIALRDMLDRLAPLADQVRASAEPHVLTLSRIQHLETEIRARVSGRSVLDLLEVLHPTPAVCGLPRDEAFEFIRGEEPFHRGWYAGPVGFFDEDGNGVFAPALRTAVGHGRTWRLFAGAGIVAGSRPDLEWAETAIKFQPISRALAAAGARLGDGPATDS